MLIQKRRITEIKKDSMRKETKMKENKNIETDLIRKSTRRKVKEVSIRDQVEFRRMKLNKNK